MDTSRVHYVKPQENHIVIDFDIPDEDGNKCYERNLEEELWTQVAEYCDNDVIATEAAFEYLKEKLSKSGAGIHLHYIYTGDDRTPFDVR